VGAMRRDTHLSGDTVGLGHPPRSAIACGSRTQTAAAGPKWLCLRRGHTAAAGHRRAIAAVRLR
jgi:hypothetical protein